MKPSTQKMPFHECSYKLHAATYAEYLGDTERRRVAETWLREDSIDAWLHRRLLQCADPLLEYYPGAAWLTVGDGRYGKDAHYLEQKGACALATDIADDLLQKGKEIGFIRQYRKENVEALSFADDSYDFVFCKESFHHFPRPMLAFYEMLRVARKGVCLIEPSDHPVLLAPRGILMKALKAAAIRLGLARLFHNRDTHIIEYNDPAFEEGGNFVYGLSERELDKAAMALNLPHLAYKDLNTFYVRGLEFEKADDSSALFKVIKERIKRRDERCARGLNLAAYDVLAAVVFKVPLEPGLRNLLTMRGYRIKDLPRNPHVK